MDVITLSSDEEFDPLRLDCLSADYQKKVPSPKLNQSTVIQRASGATVPDTVSGKKKYGSRKRINPTSVLNGSSTSQLPTDFRPSCSGIKSEFPSNGHCDPKPSTMSSEESRLTSSKGLSESDCSILFKKFLDVCNGIAQGTDMDIIISKAWRSYTACNPNYVASKDFMRLLNKKMDDLKKDTANMYSHMLEVCTELKSRKLKSRPSGSEPPTKKAKVSCDDKRASRLDEEPSTSCSRQDSGAEINNDNLDYDEDRRKRHLIKKLNTQLKHCSRIIKKLEEAEVDWDDDGDSTYMQVQLWRERAVKLYKKICEYTGERDKSSYRIHLTASNSHSKFPEVDRCIRKFVNNTLAFPDFQDILKIYKEYNAKDNLNLTPIQLQNHAADMFQVIGNELQRKRQLDNWDLHCDFLLEEPDPADDDHKLTSELKNNRQQFMSKLNQIVDDFAQKQIEEKQEPTEVTEEETNNSEAENSDAENDIDEEMAEIEQQLSVALVDQVLHKSDDIDDASSDSQKSGCSTSSENRMLRGLGLTSVSFSKDTLASADMETVSSPQQPPSNHRSEPCGALDEKPSVISDSTRLDNPLQKDISSSICTETFTASLSSSTSSKNDGIQTMTPPPETDNVQLIAKPSFSNCDASVSSSAADTPHEETDTDKGASVGISGIDNDLHRSFASICANNVKEDSVVTVDTDFPVEVNDDISVSCCIPSPKVVNNSDSDNSVKHTVVDQLPTVDVVSNSFILSTTAGTDHEEEISSRDTKKLCNESLCDSYVHMVPGGTESKGSENIDNSQAVAVGVTYNNESLPALLPANFGRAMPGMTVEANKVTTTAIQIEGDNSNSSASTSAVVDKKDRLLVTTETDKNSSCSVSSTNCVSQIKSSVTAIEANANNIDDSVDSSSVSPTAMDVGTSGVGTVAETDLPCSETSSPYSKEKGIDNFVSGKTDHTDNNESGSSIQAETENKIMLPDKMVSDYVMPQGTIISPTEVLEESPKVLTLPKVEPGVEVKALEDSGNNDTITPSLLQAARVLDGVSSEKSDSSTTVSLATDIEDKVSVPEKIEDDNYPTVVSGDTCDAIPCPIKEAQCHPSKEKIDVKEIDVDNSGTIANPLHSCSDVTSDIEVDLRSTTNDCKPDFNPFLGASTSKTVTLQESNLQPLPSVHPKIKDRLTGTSPDQIDPNEFCSVQVVNDSEKVLTIDDTSNDPSDIDIGNFLSVEIEADNVKKRVSIPRKVGQNEIGNEVSNFISIEVDTLSPNTSMDRPATECPSDPLEDEVECVAITPARVRDNANEADPDVIVEKVAVKKFTAIKMTPNRHSKSLPLPKLVQKEEDIDISNYLSVEVKCDNSPLLVNVPENSLKSKTVLKRKSFRGNPYHRKNNSQQKDVSSEQHDMNKFVAVEIGLTAGDDSRRRPTAVAAKSKYPVVVNSKLSSPIKISPPNIKQPYKFVDNSNYKIALPAKGGGCVNSSLLKLSNKGSITVERLIPSIKVRPLGRPGFSNSKNMSQLATIDDDVIVLD